MVQDNYGTVATQFSVGGVIGASISIVLRNILKFLAIGFLMAIPTILLAVALFGSLPVSYAELQSGVKLDFTEISATTKVLFALVFVVGFLSYFVIQAAINYAAFQSLRGERVGIGACLARGLAAMPRLVIACIVLLLFMFLIAIAVGIVIALLVAGIGVASGSLGASTGMSILSAVFFLAVFVFLFVIWWVFVPAIVAENAGPVGCFKRSRQLTKGHRWGILGILVLVFVANILSSIVMQLLARVGLPTVVGVLNGVLSLFFAALTSVLAAVGYYSLRAEKEGFGISDLAGVFD
jgi:hypothetical protein